MRFTHYNASFREGCMAIFDSNADPFFAPAERADFHNWLVRLETNTDRSEGAIHYYVVEVDDSLVACGGFYVSADGWQARMAWGMVHRDWHRRGIGTAFLRHRINRIRQMHPFISIALDTTQHSVEFYEKQGFVTTKITPDFYAPGMHRYDMVLRGDQVSL